MRDFIFIAGAPGSGKSNVAEIMQRKLDCPLFEFGWIPEFRNTGAKVIDYAEEEALAFENLALVAKNYAKHGFKNVIITDLNNNFVRHLPDVFRGYDFAIYTLRLDNDDTLKQRVLASTRSSKYRDWKQAQTINRQLHARKPYTNETIIDISTQSADDIAAQILTKLGKQS